MISQVAARIGSGLRILVDSSALVAYLDGTEATSAAAASVLDGLVRSGRNEGIVSTVTVSEVLVRPYEERRAGLVAALLMDFPNLVIRPVDVLVAAESARMRSRRVLRMPDAMILATGVLSTTQVIVTNDGPLARAARELVPEMSVVLLSDLAAL